jgi:Tfp pilus assembly protein PilE
MIQELVVLVVFVACILPAAFFAYQNWQLKKKEKKEVARATALEMAADLQRVQDNNKAAATAKPAALNPPLLLNSTVYLP